MYSRDPIAIAESDIRAILNSDSSLHGIAIKVGLSIRSLMNLDFYTTKIPIWVGYCLMYILKTDPFWINVFKDYGVDLSY